MSNDSNPSSWLTRLIRTCWMILGAVIALTITVQLLACIWVPLVILGLIAIGTSAALWWVRRRSRW